MNEIIVQVNLSRIHPNNRKETLTTWLDKAPKLKEGASVRFKGETEYWTVDKIYKSEHVAKEFDWHRKWDNNI